MKTANVLEGGKAIDPSCALWAVRMNLFFKSAISIPITYFFKQSCKIDLIRVAILFFQYEVELLTDNTSMSSTSDKTSIISASGGISMQFVSLTASWLQAPQERFSQRLFVVFFPTPGNSRRVLTKSPFLLVSNKDWRSACVGYANRIGWILIPFDPNNLS